MIETMLKSAKRGYVLLARMKGLLDKERATRFPLTPGTRLRSWRLGFLGESSVIYDWARNAPMDYVTDLERFALCPSVNGNSSLILDDKIVFRKVVGLVLPVPRHIGELHLGALRRSNNKQDLSLEEFLATENSFVVKPVRGGGGSSVRVFEKTLDVWTINGTQHCLDSIISILRSLRSSLVDEKVQNGEYAARISGATLNTLRILTMAGPGPGSPFIARAIHRFGTSRSAPVDNWTQGGLSVSLDVDSGVLGKGATYPVDGKLKWYSVHPETGEPIEGVTVPWWDTIKKEVLRAADIFSHVPYIGWDVVAREDGFVVIEGNSNTDVNLLQLHGPLLTDSRVLDFYRRHGALAFRR
ncbi:MAG: hypothetical protein JXA57_19035 [Armatimonadetes bacterium]|nr:hypothetical protein [Armatimonadota bacterium]